MKKGNINVETENIFPIIKKFLYSDHEIFLRELVSNAVDATQKLKALSSMGEFKGEMGDITIDIEFDKDKKTISIIDRGIGMTEEEVDKYINQIAFSSAEEFLEKFKGIDEASIIGHFGLGFYSAFMVADRVDLITKSWKEGAKAVKWSCDGSPEYTIEEVEKEERGTEIILHIAEDSLEFVDETRILELLKKYGKFLPTPIRFGKEKTWETPEGEEKAVEKEIDRIINNTNPLWKKAPSEIKEDEYNDFYRELYPMSFDEPLFNIHLNVDYPFNLTGILYFPKAKQSIEVQKEKIHLYSNQVYITDQLEGIVPDFLTLLHGVIDSPDIPLNVSRSYLQSDANVKKISGHISKKVADKLEEMFKNNREDFEAKWDDINVFIKYGMITDEKFYERAMKFMLFKNIEGKYFTADEYKKHIETLQKDKNDTLVYLYTNDAVAQHSYIENAKEKAYDVLIMDGVLDSHFVNHIESKFEKSRFARVDSDVIDKLIEKEEEIPSKLSEDEIKSLTEVFENQVDKEKFMVSTANLSESEMPIIITQAEFMRRWKDMQQLSGQQAFMPQMESYNMVINSNHPLMGKILSENDEGKKQELSKQIVDLALLSQNILKGEALTEFVKRSVNLIAEE
ncbi:MAG: molecular chaperone HtpG [Bacteroidales bacterium]|nr:molecular chaperone HtpG [Bacteroidales bacterium]